MLSLKCINISGHHILIYIVRAEIFYEHCVYDFVEVGAYLRLHLENLWGSYFRGKEVNIIASLIAF